MVARPRTGSLAKKGTVFVTAAACLTGSLAFWYFHESKAVARLPSAYYESLTLDDEYVYAATTAGLLRIAKQDGAVTSLVHLDNPRLVTDARVVGDGIYFTVEGTDPNENQIRAVGRDGREVGGLFATDVRAPHDPIELVSGGDGFYVLAGNSSNSTQSLVHVPTTGEPPVVLASGLDGARELTVDGSMLHWREHRTPDDEWTYKTLPRAGGSPTVDEKSRAGRVADARYIYRIQQHEYGPATFRPTLTGGSTYRDFTTRIVRVPKGGGPSQTIYETKANREIECLAADGDHIYWVEERHPFVGHASLLLLRMPKPGP